MYTVSFYVGPTRAVVSLMTTIAVAVSITGCGSSTADPTTNTDLQAIEQETAQIQRETAEKEARVRKLEQEVDRAKDQQPPRQDQAQSMTAEEAQASRGAADRSNGPDTGTGVLSDADHASFRQLESTLGGRSGIAVSRTGAKQTVSTAGSFQEAVAWSTSKVPVAMAAIANGSAKDSALTAAITASDNGSAEQLWQGLGGGSAAAAATDQQLRASGDASTNVQPQVLRSGFTAFGQTLWSLENQVRFTAAMACTNTGKRLLDLMGQTISAQRWGLGSTAWSAKLKGGWGPGAQPGEGGGYVDRQMGVMTDSKGRQLAVAILTEPSAGSHEAGIENLNRIAAWLVEHVNAGSLTSTPSC